DERPEEIDEIKKAIRGEVLASTFDEPPARHAQVADMALERAKRMVEQGHDVLLVLDSLTRLTRAYAATVPAGGRTLYGLRRASQPPRRREPHDHRDGAHQHGLRAQRRAPRGSPGHGQRGDPSEPRS